MSNITSYAAFNDAQANNDISRNVRQYRDLDLFFTKKSGSNDISKITDIEAVKRSIRNLVLINFYEKPFHPEIGSGVRGLLFELATPMTAIAISQSIQDVIANYEPRASINFVTVDESLDDNSYDVTINFTVINGPPETVDLSLTMEVLR